MNLLKLIQDTKIENIPVLKFCNFLDTNPNFVVPFVFKDNNEKTYVLKCIKEYYKNPVTDKKMKSVNIANRCNVVRQTFSLTKNIDHGKCFECHKLMIQKLMNSEAKLLK